MFCSNCGCQCAENMKFCQNCGAPLTCADDSQPPYQQPYAPQQAYQQAPQTNVRSAHPILNVVKSAGASPLFLTAVIAYTAALLLSLLKAIQGSSGILEQIYRVAYMLDMEDVIGDIYYAVRGTSVVSAIIGMIPTILIALGLWLIYASAVNRQDNGMKTTGLTIVKVIVIIQLVLICIACALIEIAVLFAVINLAGSYYGAPMVTPLVGVMIGAAIIFALAILYDAKIIQSINAAKTTIVTGNPSDRVSAYVAVFAFIFGVFTVISAFFSGNALALLANLCSAVSLILFGVIIFSYRSKMRTAMMQTGHMAPVSTPPVQYAVPQQPNMTYSQPANHGCDQPTTVLSGNDVPRFVTCENCKGQYNSQENTCPYCGWKR